MAEDAPDWALDHEIVHVAWELTGFSQLLAIQVKDASVRDFLEEQFAWGTAPAILESCRQIRHNRRNGERV